MIWLILLIIGIILFPVEFWCAKHTWISPRQYVMYDKNHWEKYEFKNMHLLLLLLLNIIPILNIIGAIIYFIVMYADSYNYIYLMPPEDTEEDVVPSKLDKWLNKTI